MIEEKEKTIKSVLDKHADKDTVKDATVGKTKKQDKKQDKAIDGKTAKSKPVSVEAVKTAKTIKDLKDPKTSKSMISKKQDFKIDIQEMEKKGVHLGHRVNRLHPKMSDYVIGVKNTIHIIDLKQTAIKLKDALEFISQALKEDQNILLVGTKPPLKRLVQEIAQECNISYINERWLGGTLTNFKTISQRVEYYQQLKQEKEKGNFEKFSKKERIKKEKELGEMRKKFEGMQALTKIPDIIFICDIVKDKLALKEARMKNIKTIAIVDTNTDPTLVNYPIPANDDAISSVRYILEKVKDAILKNKG